MVEDDEAVLREKSRFAERTAGFCRQLQFTGIVDLHGHRIGAYARRGRSPHRVDQDALFGHEPGFEQAVQPCGFSHLSLPRHSPSAVASRSEALRKSSMNS